MKKISRKKKIFLVLSSCLTFLIYSKIEKEENIITYNENYEDTLEFASYNQTKIYIGKSYFIEKIRDDSSKDIYIIDERNRLNSNISICNSYEIRNLKDMNTILDILLEFENKYPSNWNRTKKSMLNEWIIHNICYDLHLQRDRTMEVDLDNNDEKIFKHSN